MKQAVRWMQEDITPQQAERMEELSSKDTLMPHLWSDWTFGKRMLKTKDGVHYQMDK